MGISVQKLATAKRIKFIKHDNLSKPVDKSQIHTVESSSLADFFIKNTRLTLSDKLALKTYMQRFEIFASHTKSLKVDPLVFSNLNILIDIFALIEPKEKAS